MRIGAPLTGIKPAFGVFGTDLGIPCRMPSGEISYTFGDSFESPAPSGMGWRSPVMLVADRNGNGWVRASGGSYAKQLLTYQHQQDGKGTWTIIPTDVITIGSRMFMSYMSVREWHGDTWTTNYAGLAYSDDNGEHWSSTALRFGNNPQYSDVHQMWSMCMAGDYVYVFTTANGRDRNSGLHLMRIPRSELRPESARQDFESWANIGQVWQWVNWATGPTTPILPGAFGEVSVRMVGGRAVLVYLQDGAIQVRTAAAPDMPWSQPDRIVGPERLPQLYGGFIHPDSTLDEDDGMCIIVSQWRTQLRNQLPYHVLPVFFRLSSIPNQKPPLPGWLQAILDRLGIRR